jgi:hypothetical protein
VTQREESLRSGLEAADIQVISLRGTRPRMEEAFISLVRRRMEETEDLSESEGRD